jgi:hypothetical protein
MDFEPIEILQEELAAIPVTDEQGLLEYLPLAARLAALGAPAPLKAWPQLAEPFKDRVEQLLVDRAKEGIWDLRHALGAALADAVIDAQDFYCFLRSERGILPPRARRALRRWTDFAEAAPLDEAGARLLRRFLRRFRLPRRWRLAIVHAPVTEFTNNVLRAAMRPRPVIEAHWEPLTPSRPAELPADFAVPLKDVVYCDDRCPSARLKRMVERLQNKVDVPTLGRLLVSRRLNDRWQLIVDLECAGGAPPEVDTVRLGLLGGNRVDNPETSRWLIDLLPLEHSYRANLIVDEPLIVNLHGGCRLHIQ